MVDCIGVGIVGPLTVADGGPFVADLVTGPGPGMIGLLIGLTGSPGLLVAPIGECTGVLTTPCGEFMGVLAAPGGVAIGIAG